MIGRHGAAVALVAVSLLATVASEAAPADPSAEVPVAVESHDRLKSTIRPLTERELAALAVAWRERLQDKVRQISDLRVGGVTGGNVVAPSPGAELSRLQAERTILTDRLRVVLDEWERKGGDPKEFRLYASAVNGLEMDVTDAGTTLVVLKNWLLSPQGGIRWVGNIVRFLVILFASWLLSKFLSSLTGRAIAGIKGASSLLRTFLVNFVRQATLLVGLVVSLSALEINTSPLLALIGGAAFVVGLALQGTLANFAQGLLILAYRPFDVGDVIDAAGVSGIVDSMNMLSTTIRTFDNKLMIVPNGKIGGDTITNATASPTRRVDLMFGIGYDDDIDTAQGILTRIVSEHPLVLKDPEPVIKLNELADSSMNFVVRPWAKTGDYWTVYWDVTAAVKRGFDKAGVSIPYPQRDVHLHQVSDIANA